MTRSCTPPESWLRRRSPSWRHRDTSTPRFSEERRSRKRSAAGLRRYGRTEAFLSMAGALFDAALEWEGARMPELFCGFSRSRGLGPTRYPVACSPQAWAAGVPFHLLGAMLGFLPDARENR